MNKKKKSKRVRKQGVRTTLILTDPHQVSLPSHYLRPDLPTSPDLPDLPTPKRKKTVSLQHLKSHCHYC